MARAIGVFAAEHIAVGLVEGDAVAGELRRFPEAGDEFESLMNMPVEEIARRICQEVAALDAPDADTIGVGLPGVIRDGVVLDSPNLVQLKGHDFAAALRTALAPAGIAAAVHVLNDADAIAAGVAATRGHLDRFVRVWTLGTGVGYGRYPRADGVWEGGHTVVTLDPDEKFCGCGGLGHLEGVVGHRAMRLRFLDLEPEEVFERAAEGDARCADFVVLFHRALAAATATAVHMEGPGRFFVCGPNARFVQPPVLDHFLHEMVKMSPLQGAAIEIVRATDEVAVAGAAVSARRAGA